MGGIRLVNQREKGFSLVNISTSIPPHAPTSTGVLLRMVAPKSGRMKGATVVIVVPGTLGNSTDHLQTVKVDKRGVTGAVGAVAVAGPATLKSAVTGATVLRAAGDIVQVRAVAGNRVVAGEILEFTYTETGTMGTGTRATYSICDIEFEADDSIDAMQ